MKIVRHSYSQNSHVYICFSDMGDVGVKVTDFSTSWRDGMAFNAMVNNVRKDLIDMASLEGKTNKERLEQAFAVADRELGIPMLMDPEGRVAFKQLECIYCFNYISVNRETSPSKLNFFL